MANAKFLKLVNNKFLFQLYLLKSLPLAFIAGIGVQELTTEKAIVTIKYKWLTQNPFRSMYFACQAMAAEMSTGLLVMSNTYEAKPAISMLIVKNEAVYHKKAIGKIKFVCTDGNHITEIVEKLKHSPEGIITDIKSIGIDEQGNTIAEFVFTWSLKIKN